MVPDGHARVIEIAGEITLHTEALQHRS